MLVKRFKLSFIKRLKLKFNQPFEYKTYGKDKFYRAWTWCLFLRNNGFKGTKIEWGYDALHHNHQVRITIRKDKSSPVTVMNVDTPVFQFAETLQTVKMVGLTIYDIK